MFSKVCFYLHGSPLLSSGNWKFFVTQHFWTTPTFDAVLVNKIVSRFYCIFVYYAVDKPQQPAFKQHLKNSLVKKLKV